MFKPGAGGANGLTVYNQFRRERTLETSLAPTAHSEELDHKRTQRNTVSNKGSNNDSSITENNNEVSITHRTVQLKSSFECISSRPKQRELR